MDYIDPIPPIIRMIKPFFEERVYGNTFPSGASLPCVLIKTAGGLNYTRLQVVTRGNSDIEVMQLLIRVLNFLTTHFSEIKGIRVMWMETESNPISSVDDDTGKPEAWAYLRMEHLEA